MAFQKNRKRTDNRLQRSYSANSGLLREAIPTNDLQLGKSFTYRFPIVWDGDVFKIDPAIDNDTLQEDHSDAEYTQEKELQPLKRKLVMPVFPGQYLSTKVPKVEPPIDNDLLKNVPGDVDYTAFGRDIQQVKFEEKRDTTKLTHDKNDSSNLTDVSTFYVCSREGKQTASILKKEHEDFNDNIVVCDDIGFFIKKQIPTERCEVMFLIVDTFLLEIVMRKQRLDNAVYDYFSDFEGSSKVFLINRLPKEKEWYFQGLKYQLPESCVKDYTEIVVTVAEKKPTTPKADNSLTAEAPDKTTKDAVQVKGNIATGSSDGLCLQSGDECVMHVSKSKNQTLNLRQDGHSNTINVKIAPKPDVTKIVIVATDPTNPVNEKVLKKELTDKTECINLKLKNSGIQIVDITSGSVIIKLQAREGQYVDREMLEKVINIMFGEVDCVTMDFKLDVESSYSVLTADFAKFMKRKEEDVHSNCITKNHYDDLKTQLDEAEKKLKGLKTRQKYVPVQQAGVSFKRHTLCVRELQDLRRRFADLKRRSTYHHIGCVPRAIYEAKLREIDELRGRMRNSPGPGVPQCSTTVSCSKWFDACTVPQRLNNPAMVTRDRPNFPYAKRMQYPRQTSNPY